MFKISLDQTFKILNINRKIFDKIPNFVSKTKIRLMFLGNSQK